MPSRQWPSWRLIPCGLQGGDTGCDLRLEAVGGKRTLVVLQRLLVVARLVTESSEGGQGSGVAGIDGKCLHELRLRLVPLVRLF